MALISFWTASSSLHSTLNLFLHTYAIGGWHKGRNIPKRNWKFVGSNQTPISV